MAGAAAAGRYAKALFQLAKEQGAVTGIRTELRKLAALLDEHPELREVLLQPLHPAPQRRAVLAQVGEKLGSSPLLKSFTGFLIDQRRFVDLEAIEQAFVALADADAGLTKAVVRTASPLTDDQRARLQQALARRAGTDVELEVQIDESLLGGVVAKIGDTVYDGSLKSQLQQLRLSLHRH